MEARRRCPSGRRRCRAEGKVCLLLEGRFRKGAALLLLRRDELDVDVSCSLTQPPNAKPLGLDHHLTGRTTISRRRARQGYTTHSGRSE